DIQGSGALPTQLVTHSSDNGSSYSTREVSIGLYDFGAEGGVIVSSWRLDGNNQVGQLNQFLVNAQTVINAQGQETPTYPLPITLEVGGALVGYLPSNVVRGDDLLQQFSNPLEYPNIEGQISPG